MYIAPSSTAEKKRRRIEGARIVISAAGLVVLVVGAVTAFLEIQTTNRALNARNVFLIQKEARDVRSRVFTEEYRRILDNKKDLDYRLYSDKDTACCRKPDCEVLSFDVYEGTWVIFNSFMSVYRLSGLNAIPPTFSEAFAREFCGFIKRPAIRYIWKRRGQSHRDLVRQDDNDSKNPKQRVARRHGRVSLWSAARIESGAKEERPYDQMERKWCKN